MDYSALLRRAWEITKTHRTLWVLGILATLIGAGDFGVSFQAGVGGGGGGGGGGQPGDRPGFEISPEILQFLRDYGLVLIAGLVVFSLLLGMVLSLLGWWLKGGLIQAIDSAHRKEAVSLGEALRVGGRRLLPLWLTGFLLNLPSGLIGLLSLGVIVATLSGSGVFDPEALSRLADDPFRFVFSLGAALACVLPLACIAVIVRFALSFIETLAVRAVVLERADTLTGIRRGWALLMANLAPNLILWLIFLVAGYLFNFLASLPALALIVPAVFAAVAGQFGLAVVLGVFAFTIVYLIVSLLGGVGMVFKWSAWNLAYRSFVDAQGRLPISAEPAPTG